MKFKTILLLIALSLGTLISTSTLRADSAYELTQDGRQALHQLYAKNSKARMIAGEAL